MRHVITFVLTATALFGQAVIPFPQGTATTWELTDLGTGTGVRITPEAGYYVSYTRLWQSSLGYPATYVIGVTQEGALVDPFSPGANYTFRESVGVIEHQAVNPVTGLLNNFQVILYTED